MTKLTWGLVAALLAFDAVAFQPDPGKLLKKLAFGSCNFQLLPQGYWDVIAAEKPELWVWGGDNIYADKHPPFFRKLQWNLQYNAAPYARFRKATPVIGTWDDHDYGDNDIGGQYHYKKESQQLLLDFLEEPADSPRRKQEGVYTSYLLGPEGRRVRIILLDLRYHRQEPGPENDLLGPAQWAWLESELGKRDAAFTLLVSSSQVLPIDNLGEKWGDYPASRERLFRLIQAFGPKLAILSGDLHFGELTSHYLGGGIEIFELLSSGLTHSSGARAGNNRVKQHYVGKNFAVVRFDWGERNLVVHLDLKKITGETAFSRALDVPL